MPISRNDPQRKDDRFYFDDFSARVGPDVSPQDRSGLVAVEMVWIWSRAAQTAPRKPPKSARNFKISTRF